LISKCRRQRAKTPLPGRTAREDAMNAWKWAICCAALLAMAGCRTPPAATALERECRMLEDQIYMLEDELARSDAALQACQGTSARAPRATASSGRLREEADSTRLPSLRGPHLTPDANEFKSPVDPRSLRLPDVEVPGSALPSGAFPKTLPPPSREQPSDRSNLPAAPPDIRAPAQPNSAPGAAPAFPTKPSAYQSGGYPQRLYADPRSYAARQAPPRRLAQPSGSQSPRILDPRVIPAQAFALDPRADNSHVDRITLNRVLTGGYNRDSRIGDAGLMALVEPRDALGQMAPVAGPISVVVLDRGMSGNAARVARWDFTAEQAASLYRRTPHGEGFYLEMPWPGTPPARSHLHLFVRYTTKDGRNLEASREIDVALPPQRQQGWASLTMSAPEPEPTQTAKTWQQKPRRYEDSPVRSAVAEEPVKQPAANATRTAAREVTAAHADDAAPDETASPARTASTAAKLQRPEWSPLRP